MDATVVAHIIEHLDPNPSFRPLFIAIQGPQGCGKSFLSAQVKKKLSDPPYSLNVSVLSLDDLYLPHDDLVALAAQSPVNSLWDGRGLPGTHDVNLGLDVLEAFQSQAGTAELPIFDKSLFDGQGDRLPTGLVIHLPVDVVILEGWCVGFFPISEDELDKRWNGIWRDETLKLNLPNMVTRFDLERVNKALKRYVAMWAYFDLFVQIKPTPLQTLPSVYSIVYRWRLEQEHNMKISNGGRGMSDEAVNAFVNRYIPGYIFFGDIPPSPSVQPQWTGKGLRLSIDEKRRLVDIATF